jgi:hypothetical protein
VDAEPPELSPLTEEPDAVSPESEPMVDGKPLALWDVESKDVSIAELCEIESVLAARDDGRMVTMLSSESDGPSTKPSLDVKIWTFLRLLSLSGVVSTMQNRDEASVKES